MYKILFILYDVKLQNSLIHELILKWVYSLIYILIASRNYMAGNCQNLSHTLLMREKIEKAGNIFNSGIKCNE